MPLASQSISNTVYNVKDMGCVGDNSTDDRPILQAIINRVISDGGGIIYFPSGNYIVSRTGVQAFSLQMSSSAANITFRGVRGQSFLKHPTGMPNASVSILKLDRCQHILFDGMGFDGNWGNAQTVISEASTGLALPLATINVEDTTDFPSAGSMTIISSSGAQVVTYTGKTAQSFTGCGGGVGTIMRNYQVILVDANTGINQTTQVDPKNYNVFCRGTYDLIFRECMFRQVYGDGIWLGSSDVDKDRFATHTRVMSCDFNLVARDGITFGSAAVDCVIDSCRFTNQYQSAVHAEPVSYPVRDVVIQNSHLGGWADPALFGVGASPLTVEGGAGGYTTLGSAGQNWRIVNNRIEGVSYIEYTQDIVFANNQVFIDNPLGIGRGGISVQFGGGDISILDNYIYQNNSISGLDAFGIGSITIYNSSSGNATFDPINLIVRGNKLHVRNGRHGINLVAPGGKLNTTSGVATVITATTLQLVGAGWTVDQFAGCIVRVGTAEMSIASNTADTLTGDLVDNSTTSAWQTDSGAYAPTPAAAAFIIFRPAGTIDIDGNDIDLRNDGNGNGLNGIFCTMTGSGLPGMRVRIRNNKLKSCNTNGIFVTWPGGGNPMRLMEIVDNQGIDDQPTPTMTNLMGFSGTPSVTKWIMRGNSPGDGVTNVSTGLSTGTWLVHDGVVQQWAGYGSPETVVTAPIGSIYQRLDGSTLTSFYVKTSGAGNTGWTNPASAGTSATVTNAGSPYTVLASDTLLFVDTSGGVVSLNLPNPANQPLPNMLRIFDTKGTFNSNNCTLVRFGAEKIEGLAASKVLQTNWGSWVVVTNQTDWFVS